MATPDQTAPTQFKDADEELLAELGYKQQLNRAWSGFSNFAISFSIISVLAGCFTAYAFAWNNGGPIAISIGWPVVSLFILIIGLSLAELVAKYPTSGGIYWFAGQARRADLGLVHGLVQHGRPDRRRRLGRLRLRRLHERPLRRLRARRPRGQLRRHRSTSSPRPSCSSCIILILTAIINIFRTHLLAVINNVSVWWHVIGVVVIIALLLIVPDKHQDLGFVFGQRLNNSGFDDGATSGLFFWIYLLPIGFLLTQYTITGFDASAHLSEETHNASRNAARGVWTSIFYSAIIGWLVLLAITFAVQNPANISNADNGFGAGSCWRSSPGALDTAGFKAVRADLHGRSAVLRARLPDQRLADVLRLLARPRHAGVAPPRQGEQGRGPVQRRDGHGGAGADHHDPGPQGRPRARSFRSPSSRSSRSRDRALHRLRDPDLPALAHGQQVRAGEVLEPRAASGGG